MVLRLVYSFLFFTLVTGNERVSFFLIFVINKSATIVLSDMVPDGKDPPWRYLQCPIQGIQNTSCVQEPYPFGYNDRFHSYLFEYHRSRENQAALILDNH